jgi:hypothetical protein
MRKMAVQAKGINSQTMTSIIFLLSLYFLKESAHSLKRDSYSRMLLTKWRTKGGLTQTASIKMLLISISSQKNILLIQSKANNRMMH